MALDLQNFRLGDKYWYRRGQPKTPYVMRNCEHCGHLCMVTQQSIIRGGGRFCSVRCAKLGGRSPFAGLVPEQHPQWRGDAAGYTSMHQRVYRQRGKASFCVFGCQDQGYEWANLTGKLSDPGDYTQMCVRCHRRFDVAIRSMTKA